MTFTIIYYHEMRMAIVGKMAFNAKYASYFDKVLIISRIIEKNMRSRCSANLIDVMDETSCM